MPTVAASRKNLERANEGLAHRTRRNEVIELRALLKIAYKAMLEQNCMIPGPLRLWMRAHKPTVKQRISKLTPDGLQQFIINNHLTVEDLKELEKCDGQTAR